MGGAAAALLGLLFVAVSIRAEPIGRSDELRNRAAQTMALLLTGLLASALTTVPGQSKQALGAEFIALTAVATVVARRLDRRAGTEPRSALGRLLDTTNPTIATCVLLLLAGVVLVLGQSDGLYALVPALFAVMTGGVVNAWLILVKLDG